MKTILKYLQEHDIDFIAPCNGQKKCGKCKVIVSNRKVKINQVDRQFLSKQELKNGYRLACSHKYCQGDQIITSFVKGVIEDNLYLDNNLIISNQKNGIGVIVDIGTTTVAMKWIDLLNGKVLKSNSFFNPQAKFGTDIIARINFDNHDDEHLLSNLIIKAIFDKLSNKEKIQEMIVCGNVTMINLFLKEKVQTIGVSPFNIPIKNMQNIPISYFINNSNNINIVTINHISAFVGGDIVMGIYATDMDQKTENSLLMDLGTNGEMVIGNKEQLLATSCPAGPAFEGVNIECGGPSINGAICQTTIINNNVSHETIGNCKATSICGSGLISLIANLKRLGIIDNLGNFTNGQKKYYLNDKVYISIKDIKAFILAKAAIQAGKDVLKREFNKKIDTIYIAGGFGNYLKKEDLVTLNIISEEEAKIVRYIKNSALSGTYRLLLSREFSRVEKINQLAKVIYLEKNTDFNDLWLDAMVIE